MTQKHVARKVQKHWDLNLALDDLGFLGLTSLSPNAIGSYFKQYRNFLIERQSENAVAIVKGVLKRLQEFLDSQDVTNLLTRNG